MLVSFFVQTSVVVRSVIPRLMRHRLKRYRYGPLLFSLFFFVAVSGMSRVAGLRISSNLSDCGGVGQLFSIVLCADVLQYPAKPA